MTGVLHTRRHVALVSFDFGELCAALANGLSSRVDVSLLLPTGELELVRDGLDARVRVASFTKPRLRQPLRQLAMCRAIVREVRRLNPDVVHVQQGHLWFNLVLGQLPRPLVVTVHDHEPHLGDWDTLRTPRAATRLAFKRADRLIVHAQRLKRDVVTECGVSEQRVHVVPLVAIGSGPGPVSPLPAEDPRTVLFFGRIWPYKGLDVLIRAQPIISRLVPDARFVIAGKGEGLERYRRLMHAPGRFEVHEEFVSVRKRAELFARAAVVVLPYIEASQSGVVPIAYAFSKPVVATAVGGLAEAVDDGRTGFIVPPRDERALAEAVGRLLTDEALRRRMGAAGRRRWETEWSPETIAQQTMPVYDLACAELGRDEVLG